MPLSDISNSRLCIALAGVLLAAGCVENAAAPTDAQERETAQAQAPTQAAEPVVTNAVGNAEAAATAMPVAGPSATKPFAFDAGSTPESAPPACRLDGFVLPANAKVYAAGAYSGARADFQIDESGHQATTIQVAVNQSDVPVVLLLGAYEPTVWSVGWTQGTRIAAVLLTGYHRQRVTGLPVGVPTLVSTYDNRGPCGYAYVGGDGMAKINPMARQVFGRAVDVAYPARDGRVAVGRPLAGASLITDAAAVSAEDFRLKGVPPAGQAGIDAALSEGILRRATQADVVAWEAVERQQGGAGDVPPIEGGSPARPPSVPYRGYTVLKAFKIPAGLNGAHSATFYVAPGAPLPTGNPGHSAIQDINTGRCIGLTCGMR